MHTVVSLGRWTHKGLSSINGTFSASREALSSLGIEVKLAYWCVFGPYDTVFVTKVPDLATLARAKAQTLELHNTDTETMIVEPMFESDIDPQMPTYVSLGTWTERRTVESTKAGSRFERNRLRMASIGVHMRTAYWVVAGTSINTVVISQADNLRALSVCRLATNTGGRIRTQTLQVFSEGEFADVWQGLNDAKAAATAS